MVSIVIKSMIALMMSVYCLEDFRIERSEPGNCETNRVCMEEIVNVTKKIEKGKIVVAIFRKGVKENKKIVERRIYSLEKYLINYRGLDPKQLVVAIGESKNKFGSIEFYIDAKPYMFLSIGYNQEFEVGECVADFNQTMFYKPKKR